MHKSQLNNQIRWTLFDADGWIVLNADDTLAGLERVKGLLRF